MGTIRTRRGFFRLLSAALVLPFAPKIPAHRVIVDEFHAFKTSQAVFLKIALDARRISEQLTLHIKHPLVRLAQGAARSADAFERSFRSLR